MIAYNAVVDEHMGQPSSWTGDATWRSVTLVAMALLGAATLVGLVVTLSGANRQRDLALQAQAHSFQVMILARSLSSTMARSEASLGRYVVSGDRKLGQLYFDQWRLAASQIDRLSRVTSGDADQQGRMARLRAAYDARGRELSLTALNTNYGKNQQAYARYYQAAQTATLPSIDDTLDSIIHSERDLLDRRTAAAMVTVTRASRLAGILAVFGLLLVLGGIALGWFTMLAVEERATARADADAATARADELAAAVLKATDELRKQERKLRQVQKMEAVGQLTGGIAHDFNNMLAVVLGGLELARRNLMRHPEEAGRNLDSATDGANRAAALTRRLLHFSREESLQPEPIVAAELVTGMSNLLDRTLGDAVVVQVEDRSAGWRVRADRIQLENAILNLAVNARDAMAGRGVLTIATGACTLADQEIGHCRAGDYVIVAVTDTGHGMTPEVAERAFEPFFTTKGAGKGTGLGLSQIFALVDQLDGEITIDTAPGCGTTVTIYLPRELAGADDSVIGTVGPEPDRSPARLRVLVVEDDPRVLGTTIGALGELGHDAVACDDPLAAPALMAKHAIDLVISDVLMPHQTGPEMVSALLADYPHLAVLFVTGFAGDVNADEFTDYPILRKPFTLRALERAVVDAVARTGSDHTAPPAQIAAE